MTVWPEKFFGSTRVGRLTGDVQGNYMVLLMRSHMAGADGLPANDNELARLCGIPVKTWKKRAPLLLQFFERRGDALFNKRVEDQILEAQQFHNRKSVAGKKGADTRWQSHASAIGTANSKPMASSSSSSSSSSEDEDLRGLPSEDSSTERPLTTPLICAIRVTREDWSWHLQHWNTLAAEQGLPLIRDVTEARKRKLRVRLKEHPDFWPPVVEECRRRNEWAREHRFPTFDQILEPRLLTKLLEGNYREPEAAQDPISAYAAEYRRQNP
jgi:uncharacterized protein YdaU (DUF1376 family)